MIAMSPVRRASSSIDLRTYRPSGLRGNVLPSMPATGPHLRIVCINDVYSLENLPRVATVVARCKLEDPADLLLTTIAGDFVAPSLLSSLDAGRGMVDCLNAIPITHASLGNHEDDIPVEKLRERIAQFRGVWLSTNVLGLDPALRLCHVIEVTARDGQTVRVGLIGVVMVEPSAYHSAPFGGATMLPPNATAVSAAEHLLLEERCDVVIPMTHQSIEEDRVLAAMKVSRPFPVIVGGHEHEPFLATVGDTRIVKAGLDADHVVVVDLRWPAATEGEVARAAPHVQTTLVPVASFEEDAEMRARVDLHMRAVHELESATLLHLPPEQTLSSVGTRHSQTSLGTLLTTELRNACRAEAALFNGGGIRANRTYRGHLTYGDLKAEVPFDNEAVVVNLPGAVLAEAVLSSRQHAPDESGGFLQVDDGIEVDAQNRIVAIGEGPLDPARMYRVALVRNLLTGMDHVEPLVRYAREHPEVVPPPDTGREVKVILVEALSLRLFAELGTFEDMDENHDGVIDPHEIGNAVARATREPASNITIDLLLKAVQHRGGSIERAEAEAARLLATSSARR